MMKNINTAMLNINPYVPGKPIEELARERGIENAIKMASNENPRGPSEHVLEAIRESSRELSRYPDGSAFILKSALAKRLGVKSEQITMGNGSNDVIELAGRVALSPGSKGMVDEHCFVVYPLTIISSNAEQQIIPSLDWGHDLNKMTEEIDEHTRIVFIANPNNPTGTWLNEDQLTQFLDTIPSHVWVVLDEAYFEYAEDTPGYPNGVELSSRYPNLIVTRTFSKVYGLAALRIGYSVSTPEFADLMNRVRQPFNTSSVALAAAEAALEDQAYVFDSIEMNLQGMKEITAGLEQLGLDYITSKANFITFEVGDTANFTYESLLNEGVVVRPIAGYGMPKHLRVTVGLPQENERFLSTLRKVI